jgi:isochorismate hydrolase
VLTRPILLCLDVQRAFVEAGPLHAPYAGDALLQCRRLLAVARQQRWTIAHCLLHAESALLSLRAGAARPVEGFEPLAREIVFERATLSAYGHDGFATLLNQSNAGVLVGGLSASLTFIATALDAFERGHRLIVAAPALAAQRGFIANAKSHAAVACDIAQMLGFSVVPVGDAGPRKQEIIGQVWEQRG